MNKQNLMTVGFIKTTFHDNRIMNKQNLLCGIHITLLFDQKNSRVNQ